ncbi:MAG: roadblock/LC7 domain-containing protein [Thermus sp.]|uniref:GTPase-activating protein MglB n=1 Tax=unclassified Thermus TaxID=2619321 RepID=UPI00023898C7|nr:MULTISPECIES: roadblock/LC7 domain-containing protein [unclassified Thermus]AEV16438.1 Roadblock/LC7 [Thermus sp. CCB_US3_UF1]MCS6868974.1 roadblock/LC7 domain-containing protein [Thermus sp.]MCS7218949.1 roadblock/LC7 domain-containing protein [Thermus sp.]MCX7848934.1 roadblock/LC7 domain-containing protein [Thermus sp.]MDW8017322.1 roadblock/LC7 domain-containing protein [Thermus sp.]
MVEPSLVLYGSLYERAMDLLEETLRETGARYGLLIDRKGFVLAHKEALWAPKPPPLDSLATLVAGNAAATQALAKLLGEVRFQELVHQGERMGLYVDEAGDHALLLLVFDENAPLGKVKLYGKRAAEALARLAEEALANPPKLNLDTQYREEAKALLDELFGN